MLAEEKIAGNADVKNDRGIEKALQGGLSPNTVGKRSASFPIDKALHGVTENNNAALITQPDRK